MPLSSISSTLLYTNFWTIGRGWAISSDPCAEYRDIVLLLCKELGWVINLEKSQLVPQQVFAFVGIHYDLISFTAHPTPENWIKVIRAVQSLIQTSSLPAVIWQSIIGIFQGQLCLVPFGRLHVRPLPWNLSQFWNQLPDPQEYRSPCSRGLKTGSQMVAGPGSFIRHSSDIYQLFPSPFPRRMFYGMGSAP